MERLEELEAEGAIQTAEINELETKCKSVKEKLETLVSQKKLEKTKNSEKIEKLTHKVSQMLVFKGLLIYFLPPYLC